MATEISRHVQNTQRRVWANRIIFVGKAFILIGVLCLTYLLWSIRAGYIATPEEKYSIGQEILPFQLAAGYSISFASDGFFSKIIVMDNSSTQQRMVLNRVYWRKERTPEGFAAKFNHPHETVKLRTSTFTGLGNPRVLSFGKFQGKYQEIEYAIVESKTVTGLKRGAIYCLYYPYSRKSFFLESAAPAASFSEKDVTEFVKNLGPCH